MWISRVLSGLGVLVLAGSLQMLQAEDLKKEVDAYRDFIMEQSNILVSDVEKFVRALKKGDVKKAKILYPLARMAYERSEPVAEIFGELDERIDVRLADLKEDGKNENDWSGFHRIEKILWEKNTTKGTEALADQLLADVKELKSKIPSVEITAETMITGAVDLLNEVSTSKITGEEETFSKTDLYDFQANVEGAYKIFEIFRHEIVKKDKKLAKDIEKHFKVVFSLLSKHNHAKKGYEFTPYDKLSKSDIKKLGEAVNKLGEPLSKIGGVLN